MKYKFDINDRVVASYVGVTVTGRIIARYPLPEANTNGYLLRLTTEYQHPFFHCKTAGLPVIEQLLNKIDN